MIVYEYSAALELFAALLSGWKMYLCSCSVGLGEKHLFFFVSFFFFFNRKMFTFYICHIVWALNTLNMPNLLNLKRLLPNRKRVGS